MTQELNYVPYDPVARAKERDEAKRKEGQEEK
jgi:hypothetical protein